MSPVEWSKYQETLFDFGQHSTANGLVIAVAGSGKTASIEEMARRLPASTQVKYLVFNKRNADEAQARMPENVSASTFHSACIQPIRWSFGRIKVDADKMHWLFRDLLDEGLLTQPEARLFERPARQLVGLAKNTGIGTRFAPAINSTSAFQDIIDHYGIDLDLPRGTSPEDTEAAFDQLIEISQGLLSRSIDDTQRIDFDDMLYMVALHDLEMPAYDMVCVDEAQDTNAIQRNILGRMMLDNGGRMIAVGDPRQAIYGFRGADADAMDLIARDYGTVELPLSINYRCSQQVVIAAQPFCPQLEYHPGAPIGSVEYLDALEIGGFGAGDAVLCRTTAPIIQLAMRLIGNHTPVAVLGRDIGVGLVSLVKKLANSHIKTILDFEAALDKYYDSESRRISRKRNADVLMDRLDDRTSALRAFISKMDADDSVDELVRRIEALFSDRSMANGVTLATVHKAKGLEWPRVFILNRSEMPHRRAIQPWQVEQENNLIYVAYTRAKIDLRMIELAAIS